MNILFCIRNDYLTNFAGDSSQLLETADYIRKKGTTVTINNGTVFDYTNYDVIHLFNLTRITETYQYFKIAQKYNKPIVLTPIYWDLSKYYHYSNDMQSIKLWDYYRQFRKEIIQGCKMVYPSSALEMKSLKEEYGDEFPFQIIYSGVSVKYEKDFYISNELISLKPYILCAARVCPRKNQLTLCEAANQIGINVILAGNVNSKSYFERCLAYSNVHYWGFLSESQLRVLYENAILHALCSFVETPGLASLEAGFYGTDIVSTCEGSAEEYFEKFSHYCNPYDKSDIKRSILSALSDTKQPELKQHIESNFLWENCLSGLYKSYCDLLENLL